MTTELATLIVNSTVTVVGMVTALGTAVVAYKKLKLTNAKLEVVDKKVEVTHDAVKTLVEVAPIDLSAKDKFRESFKEAFHREPYI